MTYPIYEVILVDNGSVDYFVEKIKEYWQRKIKINFKLIKYNPNNKTIKVLEYTEKEAELIEDKEDKFPITFKNKLILIKVNENYGFDKGNNIGLRFAIKRFNSDYILILNNDVVVDKNLLANLVKMAGKDVGLIQPQIYNYYDLLMDNLGFSCDIVGNTRPIKNLKRSKLFI